MCNIPYSAEINYQSKLDFIEIFRDALASLVLKLTKIEKVSHLNTYHKLLRLYTLRHCVIKKYVDTKLLLSFVVTTYFVYESPRRPHNANSGPFSQ